VQYIERVTVTQMPWQWQIYTRHVGVGAHVVNFWEAGHFCPKIMYEK